ILTILCILKIVECKRGQIYAIGFISPNTVNEFTIQNRAKDAEENFLNAFVQHQNKREILLSYNFNFHFILLSIKLDAGVVIVLVSRRKEPTMWADMSELLQNVCGRHAGIIYVDTTFASSFATRPLSGASLSNNLKY
uniref:Uncharacterized protein n=1 Tax=Triticum urartu TaxID=4572 RepID=A0A8R7V0D4_TRIUA